MRWLRLSLAVACLAGSLPGETIVYGIHPAPGARFALTVDKTGLLSGKQHVFLFESYRGTLLYDEAAPEHSRVDLSIQAASAVCTDKWVSEKDLKKIQTYALRDMLAADKYPELRFSSTRVARTGDGSFEVNGTLTIRDISRPAAVAVTVKAGPDSMVASLSGRSVIRLKDYGLKPPTAVLGAIGTRNEMTVEFLLMPSRERREETKP